MQDFVNKQSEQEMVRPKICIVNPEPVFGPVLGPVLKNVSISVLTETEKNNQGSWNHGTGQYFIPKGHLLSLLKGAVDEDFVKMVEDEWGAFIPLPKEYASPILED